ncbi:MAG: alpha/beta fold hydrolase [Proteobacteria bacterium]|nr:alpha/beta fold hydrolase [Pseudomonadota bacterium]
MPVLEHSPYTPSPWLANGHLQTLYPVLRRPVPPVDYTRERLDLPDGDFLDLDWSLAAGPGGQRAARVALVIHGLEGHSRRKYLRGMVRALNAAGWDCVAMNHRGCSGEMNRLARFYHSGETDDVHSALTRAIAVGGYAQAALLGFSMGGNQILKYLGENPERVPAQVLGGVAVSAPCDLAACALVLERGFSRVYQAYLMRSLRHKVREKHEIFPHRVSVDRLSRMITFHEFDEAYTAPLNGFADAADYYARCSSLRVLEGIRVPVLVLSALDDPFLAPECYPQDLARASQFVHLETPQTGGHVGFALNGAAGPYYSELRAVEFLAHS